MFDILVSFLFFGIMYAIKGGSGPWFFRNWTRVREKSGVLDRIMDGKVISTLAVTGFIMLMTKDINLSLMFGAAWLVSVAPSMGEEHGAVGRWGMAWGEYVSSVEFGREYGIKKAVQRGVWIGACMTLATGYIPFICFSLLFVPCIFIGQELNYRITKQDGWAIAEPIIGAFVYGIPAGLYLGA